MMSELIYMTIFVIVSVASLLCGLILFVGFMLEAVR